MSNCIFVDVSHIGSSAGGRLIPSDDDWFNYVSVRNVFVLRGSNNNGDYNVFDENSKTNYVSYFVRNINVHGECFTNLSSNVGYHGVLYVILYKTNIKKGVQNFLQSPVNNTKKNWSFYAHPEMVLSYRVYKIGNDITQSPLIRETTRIKLTFNKPVLVRPDEVIILQYTYFTSDISTLGKYFFVNATAEVKFDLA